MDVCVHLKRNVLHIYRHSKYFEKKKVMQKQKSCISYPINFLHNSYDFLDKQNRKRVKFVDNMRIFPDYLLPILVP